MTICIAALCDVRYPGHPPDMPLLYGILCISDRMLTSPLLEIEFEQPMKKIYEFYDPGQGNTIALTAGDTSTQIMLCDRTRLKLAPQMTVAEVADTYASEYALLRQERNERKHLAPLGLTTEAFAEASGTMSPGLAMQVANELAWGELRCEALICGTDKYGAHVFVVKDPGVVDCADNIGFAAIGIGRPHAEAILMDAHYTRNELLSNAMFLLYASKRRAEVAPGVGRDTDMVILNPFDPTSPRYVFLPVIAQLTAAYERRKRAEATAHRKALGAIERFVARMLTPPPGSAPSAPGAAGPSPSTLDGTAPPPSPGSDKPPSPAS